MTDIELIEKNCGYVFKNKTLLKKALTLSSFDGKFNNQSLECLGDALLTFIVAEKYYLRGASEGQITEKKQELLSDEALKPVSEKLGLDKALIRDKGDVNNRKAVPSAYEALIGAVYLDGGLNEARTVALSTLAAAPHCVNYVAELQELLQSRGEQPPPYRKIMGGTPQKPLLAVEVTVEGRIFRGEGQNFSSAKKIAARAAYEYMRDCF